ncbi:bile acid:sodium symporter family protein [Dendrosporobacter sp. 1207_IL3150]|uniref:bile acid:sodium symporter family protein n=1 Tax=Dendrosporobacter sp. 1207_IL3150 TaxID=3084054 RepID=UPI002FDA6F61
MSAFFSSLNNWLGRKMFLVVLSGLFLGFILKIPDTPLIRYLVVAFFAYMTFVTALGTSFKEFIKVLSKPLIPLWILVLVHFVTPLTAWLAGIIFYPDEPFIRIGYLIGASIPIGVTSVIWTALVKGNLAVSLVAVTLDTIVVPLVLPLFFNMVIGQTVEINYVKMILDLSLMVTLPSIAGMLLHDATDGRVANFTKNIGGATSKLSLMLVILINASLVAPQIVWDLSILKTMLVTLLIVSTGYFVGYLGSYVLKDRSKESVLTMIYNVGIRNNACGLVLALSYFPPAVAIPITLSILYQQPLATIIPHIYNYFTKKSHIT